ncbi:MAG: hypothetical protein ACT4QE_19110 [Anaerolineales bacterium]
MTPHTRRDPALSGRRLFIARLAWLALALPTLAIIAASVLPRYWQLATVTEAATIFAGQLRPFEAQALAQLGLSVSFYGAYFALLEGLGAAVFFVIGAVIFWRRSDERMPLLFSFALIGTGLNSNPLTTPLEAVHPALTALLVGLRAVAFANLVVAILIFPDGRFVPSWTKWLALVWVAYLALSLGIPSLRLRATIVWEDVSQALVFSWVVLWLLLIPAIQVYRYRVHFTPVQRQQTKWVVFGLALGNGLVCGVAVTSLVVSLWALPLTVVLAARMVAYTMILLSTILMAVIIAVAILRSRLWDIDVIIRRTLQYSLLSGVLAVIYFGLIVVLQTAFTAITGQQQNDFVTVASTLTIAALFFPLRNRVQNFIDRRFYRQRYDAQKVLAEFAATARDETDLEKLTARLVEVVDETMQPESVQVWLKPSEPLKHREH